MEPTDQSGFTVAKLSYSGNPWRIITPGEGSPKDRQLTTTERVVTWDTDAHVWAYVCFATKAEAVAWLGEYAWRLHKESKIAP
jgi:hypothetical protein